MKTFNDKVFNPHGLNTALGFERTCGKHGAIVFFITVLRDRIDMHNMV